MKKPPYRAVWDHYKFLVANPDTLHRDARIKLMLTVYPRLLQRKQPGQTPTVLSRLRWKFLKQDSGITD